MHEDRRNEKDVEGTNERRQEKHSNHTTIKQKPIQLFGRADKVKRMYGRVTKMSCD